MFQQVYRYRIKIMYDGFYNLEKKPFQLNADPEFFFNSEIHSRALAYMKYGLTQGEGFVVVTGQPGMGKTMLVRQLVQTLNEEEIVIGVMVTSHVDAEDTIRIVAATFGLRYEGDEKATTLTRIKRYFIQQSRNGKRVLLIVDDAQQLPKQSMEELRMLSDFVVDGVTPFQVFLVGQKELGQMLYASDMDQFRQRIVATFQLKPLIEAETKVYIEFRLQKAGWKENPEFGDGVFKKIFEFTEGIPRRINTFCDRLFLFGYLEELRKFEINNVEQVINEIDEESPLVQEQADNHLLENVEIKSDSPLVERIAALEKVVVNLQTTLTKERALLRKAILIQLDLDEVYDHSGDDRQLRR